MKINLLHVSDLHRDPHSPISNQTLLDSLERDRDQYSAPDELEIDSPDLIIVSGDIVFGVRHGKHDAEAVLQRQYEEALEFLEGLTERFVNGNRRSVIIVPGNHDVSDHHFRESLERIGIPTGGPKELIGNLLSGQSDLRWCWDDLSLYQISDRPRYSERFQRSFHSIRTFMAEIILIPSMRRASLTRSISLVLESPLQGFLVATTMTCSIDPVQSTRIVSPALAQN